MARRTKNEKDAKSEAKSVKKGTKTKRAKKVKRTMVIKEKSSPAKTPRPQKSQKSPRATRGKRYQAAANKVDRVKAYPAAEAVKLAKEISLTKFAGKLELHLNVKDAKLKREIELPYPTADTGIKKEKRQNAKNTKTPKGTKITLKTEKKFPLVHTVIGLATDPDDRLSANLEAIIAAIGPRNIRKAVLSPTMGPSVKVETD